jgi:tetratricopeptide (TPR) repeat protein
VLALVLTTTAGCTADTPLCDRAAGHLREARLVQAGETYAAAQRAGEGDCAQDGLAEVATRHGRAMTETSRGRAAEHAGDLDGARSAYEAALAVDQGNAESAAGVRRVTRRPDTLDPAWFRAQRLLDEGYADQARAEVVAVLREHPDLTVPTSLARLSAAAPSTSPTPAAAPPAPVPAPAPGPVRWPTIVLAVFVLLLAVAAQLLWRGMARTRREAADQSAQLLRLREQFAAVAGESAGAAATGQDLADEFRRLREELATVGGDGTLAVASVREVRKRLAVLERTVTELSERDQDQIRSLYAALAGGDGPEPVLATVRYRREP